MSESIENAAALSDDSRAARATIFFLHYLGGSAREWTRVIERLDAGVRCVAIDLPGFGDATAEDGYSVAAMAALVARTIEAHAPRRWLLVGHSMGAKVAAVVARHAEDGAAGLTGLEGLVVLAGSPPGPEPMDEARRTAMLGWFTGDAAADRAHAEQYVTANSEALDPASAAAAVDDVLRANRSAWTAWLERGSREDWSDRVGVLRTPALIVAGANDADLGPAAQQRRTAPHFAHSRSETLADVKHLLPLERPHDVAHLIGEHLEHIERRERRAAATQSAYRSLIDSSRVSRATRAALVTRAQPDDPQLAPAALDRDDLATLRAVMRRVLPQSESSPIDLAARLDASLDAGAGDGWRFAILPPDTEAYRAGLRTLNDAARERASRSFAELDGNAQDELLRAVAAAQLGFARPARLEPAQMRAWFEDVRADAVKAYVGHPQTLARLGYSGIANGGDGTPKSGFIRVGIGEREAWEPRAQTDVLA